ncbi:unnamed protein product, partial [Tetraodon nigroviridis]
RNLWIFVSKFTVFGAIKLHNLYKMAQKKRSHEEEASLESVPGSRGGRRIPQGGPKTSDRSRSAPVETPAVLSSPPNLPLTLARPAPTDTTGRRTTWLTNDILVAMVGGIEIVRPSSVLQFQRNHFWGGFITDRGDWQRERKYTYPGNSHQSWQGERHHPYDQHRYQDHYDRRSHGDMYHSSGAYRNNISPRKRSYEHNDDRDHRGHRPYYDRHSDNKRRRDEFYPNYHQGREGPLRDFRRIPEHRPGGGGAPGPDPYRRPFH